MTMRTLLLGSEQRVAEVHAGATAAGVPLEKVVPVVPVRMTEAWLVLDEAEIRRVAGRPASTNGLGVPPIGTVDPGPAAT